MTKRYTRDEVVNAAADVYPDNLAEQYGMLKSILSHVLIYVEVYDPKMFQEIASFEMLVTERMKAEKDKGEDK
jgi:hypothetical protein